MKQQRACFTGHRPEKLKNEKTSILAALSAQIDAAIGDGITEFISGMARGVDLWAASLVLERKKKDPTLKLICAIPYENFEKGWSEEWRVLYGEICAQADEIKFFYPRFSYASFQERNRWRVDHSRRLIAVYNGEKGGTKNTLDYARKQDVMVCVIPG